ncbi:Piwi domain-containing protein isoform 1 [Cladophialophora immunda]|nr:Piwi domain-containing protein isoform 1 [Cladophialophora immunda]
MIPRYNPTRDPAKRSSTPSDNAGGGELPYRSNPLFSPGDSRPNNSLSNPPPNVPPVANFQPNQQVAPLSSGVNRAPAQPGVLTTHHQANTNWQAPQAGVRGGQSQIPYRSGPPHTGPGSRGGRLDGGPKVQGTPNVDISGKQLLANHFAITLGDYREVYSYELKISRIHRKAQDDQSQPLEPEHGDARDQKTRPIARQKKRRLVYLLMEQLRSEKKLPDPVATDYLKLFITAKQLGQDVTKPRDLDFYDEYSASPVPGCDRYRVVFEKPKLISLANLFAHYRRPTQSQTAVSQLSIEALNDATNALNVIFSYLPYQRCFSNDQKTPSMTTTKGQTFYGIAPQPPPSKSEDWTTDTGKVLDREGGLYSIPGFSRSVRGSYSSSGHVDLNIYVKTGCFWQHGNVQDMIDAWNIYNGYCNLDDLQDFLRRAPVRLTFQEQGLDRFSAIKGLARIDREPRADNCQMQHINQQHSGSLVRDYFSMKHNWQMNPHVYVVKIGKESQKGCMTVPANLLQVLPGRIKPREIPRLSTRYPNENYNMIVTDGRRTFYSNNLSEGGAAAFRLQIDPNMAKVPVTVLARPDLMYKAQGNPKQTKFINGASINAGQWNVRDAAFVKPASGKRWSCVELTANTKSPKCPIPGSTHFVNHLSQALRKYGIESFEWTPLNRNDMSQQQYADENLFPRWKTVSNFQKRYAAIEKLLKNLKGKGIQLVVLLLPSEDPELYGAIKRVGEQAVGIFTVCHVLRRGAGALWPRSLLHPGNLNGGINHDFLANLCMKINLKVDTTTVNQALYCNPKILSPETMIIGIDVAHGGGPRKHCPSVAAVVGSVNAEFSQWPASLLANPCSTKDYEEKEANEKILDLDIPVYERLLDYYERNHGKDSAGRKGTGVPEQIIVYRDGVSESQFAMCKGYEYGKIGAALGKLFQQKGLPVELLPKVTLICAIKRHHTRLFPDPNARSPDRSLTLYQSNKSGGVNNNPLPGCVVTERITYGEGNDFFLVGQKAIQGTAIPVHYVVLQNPHNYDIKDIGEMTYHLCYLFGRSRTSVGPCTPVYYADLVADRARCFVRRFYNPPRDDDNPVTPFDDSELPAFKYCLRLHPDVAKHMFYI